MNFKPFFRNLSFAAITTLSLASCKYDVNIGDGLTGSGNLTTQTRNVGEGFKKVRVSQGIEVVIEQSGETSVTVLADDNLQKHITTKVENGTLIIETDNSFNTSKTPKVTVKMPSINHLEASGGSHLYSAKTIISDTLEVVADGGSQVNLSIEADQLSLETESGSQMEISGKALKLETSSASGSELDAEKLMANEVQAQSASGRS